MGQVTRSPEFRSAAGDQDANSGRRRTPELCATGLTSGGPERGHAPRITPAGESGAPVLPARAPARLALCLQFTTADANSGDKVSMVQKSMSVRPCQSTGCRGGKHPGIFARARPARAPAWEAGLGVDAKRPPSGAPVSSAKRDDTGINALRQLFEGPRNTQAAAVRGKVLQKVLRSQGGHGIVEVCAGAHARGGPRLWPCRARHSGLGSAVSGSLLCGALGGGKGWPQATGVASPFQRSMAHPRGSRMSSQPSGMALLLCWARHHSREEERP